MALPETLSLVTGPSPESRFQHPNLWLLWPPVFPDHLAWLLQWVLNSIETSSALTATLLPHSLIYFLIQHTFQDRYSCKHSSFVLQWLPSIPQAKQINMTLDKLISLSAPLLSSKHGWRKSHHHAECSCSSPVTIDLKRTLSACYLDVLPPLAFPFICFFSPRGLLHTSLSP